MGKLSRVEALAELGLTSADDNDDTIKTAYKRLALQHHPDKNRGSEESEVKFKAIGTAYSRLTGPEPENDEYESGAFDADLAEELFRSMFGGRFGGGGFSASFVFGGGGFRGAPRGFGFGFPGGGHYGGQYEEDEDEWEEEDEWESEEEEEYETPWRGGVPPPRGAPRSPFGQGSSFPFTFSGGMPGGGSSRTYTPKPRPPPQPPGDPERLAKDFAAEAARAVEEQAQRQKAARAAEEQRKASKKKKGKGANGGAGSNGHAAAAPPPPPKPAADDAAPAAAAGAAKGASPAGRDGRASAQSAATPPAKAPPPPPKQQPKQQQQQQQPPPPPPQHQQHQQHQQPKQPQPQPQPQQPKAKAGGKKGGKAAQPPKEVPPPPPTSVSKDNSEEVFRELFAHYGKQGTAGVAPEEVPTPRMSDSADRKAGVAPEEDDDDVAMLLRLASMKGGLGAGGKPAGKAQQAKR